MSCAVGPRAEAAKEEGLTEPFSGVSDLEIVADIWLAVAAVTFS